MPVQRSSQQLTLHSFGEISRFLREDVADDESRQLRESLGALSEQIDSVVRIRRTSTDTADIIQGVEALAACIREHQFFISGLGSGWHGLYEFGSYQGALRELRRALDQWQQTLQRRSSRERDSFDAFELLAWRTLGEALLLIDMYEQGGHLSSELPGPHVDPAGAVTRMLGWLGRWRR